MDKMTAELYDSLKFDVRSDFPFQEDEGPTCSLCDGLGHGYPGGGPCPLEENRLSAADDAREEYEYMYMVLP